MQTYIYRALVMLLAIPFHEAAHAYISLKLGDSTARDMGRLSLNPMAHFDPMGALCMILAGIGWAKPVPTRAYRFRNPKLGTALSALAGPVSNLMLAYVSTIIYKTMIYATYAVMAESAAIDFVIDLFYYMIIINVSLAVFNLLPVPPFDGSRVMLTFLPQKWYFRVMQYERYIFIGMFVLLTVGFLDGPLQFLNYHAIGLLDWATGYVDALCLALLGF